MKKIITIILTLSAFIVNAQKIDKQFVEGTWKVVSVEEAPDNPPFSLMTSSFEQAVFTFNSDQTCELESAVDNGCFAMISSVVKNAQWTLSFQSEKPLISIESNGEKQLEIFVTTSDDETYFALDEEGGKAYFLLKVEKM